MRQIARTAAAMLVFTLALRLADSPDARADFTFVHVTDTHVTTAQGNGSPASNDAARFREISALPQHPAFVFSTGDVCETATDAEYATWRKIVADNLTLPIHIAPGNHDVRWNPRGKEGYTKGTAQPLYHSWDYENIHFVALDSTVLLQHWGHFDQSELDWLAADLAKVGPDKPVIVGFHHWVGRESVQVDNEAALLRVLAPYNVRLFLIGHGHSDIQWNINGAPAIMAKGLYQGSYNFVQVTKDTLTVYKRTEQSKTPTTVILTEPLRRPAPVRRDASVRIMDDRIYVALTRGDLAADARVTCRLDDGKESPPLDANASGWSGEMSIAGAVPGRHLAVLTATNPDGRAYQTPVDVTIHKPGTTVPLWTVNVGGAVQGKLAVRGGMVYVPSMGGDMIALDGATGKEKWRAHTEGAVFSAPLVTEDTVYFGSADHKVYAVDRATGKERWSLTTDGAVFGGAALAQNILCIGSTDTRIYGIDARTGKVLWRAKGEGMYQSQAATDGERFFVGGWDNQFRCFEAKTGKPLWKQRFGRSFYYSPAIGSPAVGGGQALVTSNDGMLHAMDTLTGTIQWEVNGPSLGYSGPLRDDAAHRIYNASLTGAGRVFCFDTANGNKIWETPTGAVIYDSSCAEGGGDVFVGCVNGTFSALNAKNGHIDWQYRLAPGHLLCSPATGDGRVYCGSMSGEVYAFPLPGGEQAGR